MASDTKGIPADSLLFASAAAPALSETARMARPGQPTFLDSQTIEEPVDRSTAASESDYLLVRVQQADSHALAQLFDKYSRLVFSIGNRVLRSPTEAEDLVQDVFLFLWSRSKLFVPGKRSAHEWIIRVIYHRAFDRRRYLMTRLAYNNGNEGNVARDNNRDGDGDRVSRLASNEKNFGELLYWQSYLENAFEELSSDQRNTLTLFFYEGYTLAEISQKVGQPLMNIRNYYYRGLKRLEKYVDGNGK